MIVFTTYLTMESYGKIRPLRIVYDASAKTTGPSLNECLYTGPSFGPSIFEILVRFRYHKVVVAGDIEKAFLMVSMSGEHQDALRFL